MAMDQFIKIGDLKGEAMDNNTPSHKDEIDVLSWSWGMSNSGSAQQGGGQGAGKVHVQDLTITKYLDKSTPDLMLACCNGKHFDKATLTVRKAGETPLEYLQITMENLIISNLSTGGSGGEDRLTETVTLNFSKVTVAYKEQTEKGTVGDKPEMGWDIAGNVKQ
jgi:type VI secretion system secreted protein Hcp